LGITSVKAVHRTLMKLNLGAAFVRALLGSAQVKAARKNVDEIDFRRARTLVKVMVELHFFAALPTLKRNIMFK